MGISCVAVGCHNHNKMLNKPRFFRFPNNNPKLREKWINACRRQNEDGSKWNPTTKHLYICGDHFVGGEPKRNDPLHPAHLPTKFSFSRKMINDDQLMRRYKSKVGRNFKCVRESNDDDDDDGIYDDNNNDDDINLDSTVPYEESEEENELQIPITNDDDIDMMVDKGESSSQHEKMMLAEMDFLRAERDAAIQECHLLKSKFICYEQLKDNGAKFKYYAGITVDVFNTVFNFIQSFLPEKNLFKLNPKDQLLVTLIKLRLNLEYETLEDMFHTSKSSLNETFRRWIDLLYHKLSFIIRWPDHEANRETLPLIFKQYFPRLTCIIDCTEIFIQRPKKFNARSKVYSNYKKHSTVKFLIGCTPHGSISFVSKGWGGRVSDVELVKNSGLLTLTQHVPGDQILADRGFTLVDEFAANANVELILPAFTKGKKQLTAKEVEVSRQIASIRIHIERVIGLVKNRFRIFDRCIPLQMVKSLSDEAMNNPVAGIDRLFTVCCIFCNLGDGIVYKEKEA